nr:hypothetical protein [Tanacetum cinerariifolium]
MKWSEEWSTHPANGLVITYLNQRGRKNFDLGFVILLGGVWISVHSHLMSLFSFSKSDKVFGEQGISRGTCSLA